jgi:hypothetical protein
LNKLLAFRLAGFLLHETFHPPTDNDVPERFALDCHDRTYNAVDDEKEAAEEDAAEDQEGEEKSEEN